MKVKTSNKEAQTCYIWAKKGDVDKFSDNFFNKLSENTTFTRQNFDNPILNVKIRCI